MCELRWKIDVYRSVRRLRIDHYFRRLTNSLAQVNFEAALCGLGLDSDKIIVLENLPLNWQSERGTRSNLDRSPLKIWCWLTSVK